MKRVVRIFCIALSMSFCGRCDALPEPMEIEISDQSARRIIVSLPPVRYRIDRMEIELQDDLHALPHYHPSRRRLRLYDTEQRISELERLRMSPQLIARWRRLLIALRNTL